MANRTHHIEQTRSGLLSPIAGLCAIRSAAALFDAANIIVGGLTGTGVLVQGTIAPVAPTSLSQEIFEVELQT